VLDGRVRNYRRGSLRNPASLDPRKHRNNAMRCVCVGEESDGEVMHPSGAGLRQKCAERNYVVEGDLLVVPAK
jgi:hypothetical protein